RGQHGGRGYRVRNLSETRPRGTKRRDRQVARGTAQEIVVDAIALGSRLSSVRERIARAASRAKRDPAAVRLIAVSKTFSADHIRAVADAGQLDFGENKVQEGLAKIARTSDLPLRWHLIGHLQSNKVKQAVAFHAIDSIDGSALLQKVETAASQAGRTVEVLIQV